MGKTHTMTNRFSRRTTLLSLGGALVAFSSQAKANESRPSSKDAFSFILVDQFGYLPHRAKIAHIRDPHFGYDADQSFSPSPLYEVVDARSKKVVFKADITSWKAGKIDESSGDKVWHFDFSALQKEGSYFIRDSVTKARSQSFRIDKNTYAPVLRAAMRTFYYQRATTEKLAAYAGKEWVDSLSHAGPLQDKNARLFSAPNDPSTERDLSGGWYDAGDYNRYTNWHAGYILSFLNIYQENKAIWAEDWAIPESGNGVPDIIDEIKWGIDWLIKMQNQDGSLLSVLGVSHASPPSSAKGQSLYGPASTSATALSAAAFAYAAHIFSRFKGFEAYAEDLKTRALKAWAWASANPSVVFRNNDEAYGSKGLAAGQQEVSDNGRMNYRLTAAIYLFALTGDATYHDFFLAHYRNHNPVKNRQIGPYNMFNTQAILAYTRLESANNEAKKVILEAFSAAMQSGSNWNAALSQKDPYGAAIGSYHWGSSYVKGYQGYLFITVADHLIGSYSTDEAFKMASPYLHYMHGVNPLAKVYLSNMGAFGAHNSVDQFYHGWFHHGSLLWDSVRESTYGPPPGFVAGGVNPYYKWDKACPALKACGAAPLSPPVGQPAQKAYADFNESWPVNSWEVTENSNGYQLAYLSLLSRFVSS